MGSLQTQGLWSSQETHKCQGVERSVSSLLGFPPPHSGGKNLLILRDNSVVMFYINKEGHS